MHKYTLLIILAIATAISSYAQRQLRRSDIVDAPLRHQIGRSLTPQRLDGANPVYLPTIIKIDETTSIDELEAMGVIIMHQRDELLLAFVPTDRIDQLTTYSGIRGISGSAANRPNMDIARGFTTVNSLLTPADGSRAYLGEGTVVGFSDTGFDPHHPNFLGPDGETRVRKIVDYRDTLAIVSRAETAEQIAAWVTDDIRQTHATHVAGILTGSATSAPYYGIAQRADIVATTSQLTDACILAGVEEIIAYAKSQGRPAVVNLSLGSCLGPHDGTTLFNQYLDKLGQEAIICMSAGNDGNNGVHVPYTFTAEKNEWPIVVQEEIRWDLVHIDGACDFWSADERPFELRLEIIDHATNEVIASYPYCGDATGEWTIASTSWHIDGAVTDPAFDQSFNGYVRLTPQVNPENGRFRIYAALDVTCTDVVDGWVGRYFPVLTVKGSPGMRVDGYAGAPNCNFANWGFKGYARFDSDMSISDISCGHNVIVVGAASTRTTVPIYPDSERTFGNIIPGHVALFSAYGTLADGRRLPHISAPGDYTVSSISNPYVNSGRVLSHPTISARYEIDGREAWYGADCGTSMSSPFVAGVIAQWLEVDPELTVDEARNLLTSTAVTSAPDIDSPKWGAGMVDPVAGLRKLMALNSVSQGVSIDSRLPDIRVGNAMIRISADRPIDASLYRLDGRLVDSWRAGSSLDIPTDNYSPGLYVLIVNSTPTKILIR